MAKHEAVRKALGGKAKSKLHTHSVKYTRADNGGLHAHVERHTSSGHHHDEHHVLASPEDAAEHLQQHLGDQSEIGGSTPPSEVEAPDAGAGAGAGAASGGDAASAAGPPMM